MLDFAEFPGTLRASEEVEIRARVEGFLETMEFQPTSSVRRDQVPSGAPGRPRDSSWFTYYRVTGP